MKGFAGNILSINLTKEKWSSYQTPKELKLNYLGGDGFGTRLLYDMIQPKKNAFDPSNVIVIAPGLLNWSPLPTTGKTAFCAKSALTGTFMESIMGGGIGAELKFAGYDALTILGKAKKLSYIFVEHDKVDFRDAENLRANSPNETTEKIKEELGDDYVRVASIGLAGELLVKFACIDCEDRQAGRGGLGAVMGSKNLKALAVRGTKDMEVEDIDKTMRLIGYWNKTIREHYTFQSYTKYGTGEFLEYINAERGTFPTRNWQEGIFKERKELDPYYWSPIYSKKNKACFGCIKPCGHLFTIKKGKYKGTGVDGVEYETLYSLGSQCGNASIESTAKANELCDFYGLDTISCGVTIGFAMELYEKGILTKQDVNGLELRFGNSDIVPIMVEKIGKREGIGNLLAEGVRIASQKIGKGAEAYAIHVKGMEPPAYDVRGLKGVGLGFMTSPRGACHLRAGAYSLDLSGKFWKYEGVNRLSADGKGEIIKNLEDFFAVYDILGACKFSRKLFMIEFMLESIEAITGMKYTESQLLRIGERVNNLKRLFNLREGFGKKDDWLPKRILTEPIPEGVSKGNYIKPKEAKMMLEEYYKARGWDSKGVPTKKKLNELNIF